MAPDVKAQHPPIDLAQLKTLYVSGVASSSMTVCLDPNTGPTAQLQRQVELYFSSHAVSDSCVWSRNGDNFILTIRFRHGATTEAKAALVAELEPRYLGAAKLRVVIGRSDDHVVETTYCAFDFAHDEDAAQVILPAIGATPGINEKGIMLAGDGKSSIGCSLENASTNFPAIRAILLAAAETGKIYVLNADAPSSQVVHDAGGIYRYDPMFNSVHDRSRR